jgi:hypothetical protein
MLLNEEWRSTSILLTTNNTLFHLRAYEGSKWAGFNRFDDFNGFDERRKNGISIPCYWLYGLP